MRENLGSLNMGVKLWGLWSGRRSSGNCYQLSHVQQPVPDVLSFTLQFETDHNIIVTRYSRPCWGPPVLHASLLSFWSTNVSYPGDLRAMPDPHPPYSKMTLREDWRWLCDLSHPKKYKDSLSIIQSQSDTLVCCSREHSLGKGYFSFDNFAQSWLEHG